MNIQVPSFVVEELHTKGFVEWGGMTFSVGEEFKLSQSAVNKPDDARYLAYQKTYLGKLEVHWKRSLSSDEKKLFCDAIDKLEAYFKENSIPDLNRVGIKLGLIVGIPVVKWPVVKDFLDLAASRKFVDHPWDKIPLKLIDLLKLRKKESKYTDWKKEYEYAQCALDHYFNQKEIERLKPKKSLNLFAINQYLK